mgnify:CR=1 FL=1
MGSAPVAGRGDVCIGVRAPVAEFTLKTLIVLALMFAVYRNCPVGCIAIECGPLPLGWVSNELGGGILDIEPSAAIAYTSTALTWAAYRNVFWGLTFTAVTPIRPVIVFLGVNVPSDVFRWNARTSPVGLMSSGLSTATYKNCPLGEIVTLCA